VRSDMKTIKNISMQGLEVYVVTPNGPETLWLSPRQSATIPESYIGSHVKQLAVRRMLRVL